MGAKQFVYFNNRGSVIESVIGSEDVLLNLIVFDITCASLFFCALMFILNTAMGWPMFCNFVIFLFILTFIKDFKKKTQTNISKVAKRSALS